MAEKESKEEKTEKAKEVKKTKRKAAAKKPVTTKAKTAAVKAKSSKNSEAEKTAKVEKAGEKKVEKKPADAKAKVAKAKKKPIKKKAPKERISKRKVRVGRVVSNKMDKTAVVSIESAYSHRLYKKMIKRTKKFFVHDEENIAGVGDLVEIMENRPTSKNKRWRLIGVIEKAK